MVPLTYSISLIMLLLVSQSSMLPFASLKPPTAIKSFHCTTVREQKASVKVLRVLEFQAPWSNLSFFYLSSSFTLYTLSISDFDYVLTNENCISSTIKSRPLSKFSFQRFWDFLCLYVWNFK